MSLTLESCAVATSATAVSVVSSPSSPPQAGEANSQCRISDERVREMRTVRAASKAAAEAFEKGESQEPATLIDWPELAAQFGITAKHAYRICRGLVRPAAGGPLEDAQRPSKAEVARNFIRCKSCGGKYHRHEECQRCQTLWAINIQRELRPYGWVPQAA